MCKRFDLVDHLVIEPFDNVSHHFTQVLEIKQQPCFIEFGSRERNPDLVVVAVRIFALTLVIAQVVSRGECIFDRDFEHDPPKAGWKQVRQRLYEISIVPPEAARGASGLTLCSPKCSLPKRHIHRGASMFCLKLWLSLCVFIFATPVFAQTRSETPEFDVKEHYTKYEYRTPMRDGVHLFTSVYVPKDASHSYPFLIDRTPYSVSPYGVDLYRNQLGPSPDFDKAGYIFVFQDVRGRFMSEGKFIEMRPHIDQKKSRQDVDDSSDLYDTIEWLLKNVPNNNGNAGIWGISYPGFFTSASMIDSHPALKAASPQAPMTNLFMGDDAYHGGAFMLAANFGFYAFFRPQENPQLPPKNFG